MSKCNSTGTTTPKQSKNRNVVTTSIFIGRAIAHNGERYCYKKTIYKSYRDKLTVTCKEHGDIDVFPSTHLKVNGGCKGCNSENNPVALTKEDFISRSLSVHGSTYDYELVECRGVHTLVKIVCQKHGVFLQTPNSHMAGRGCNDCAHEIRPRKRITLSEFVKRSNKMHNSKYDYSLVDYVNTRTSVKIICGDHGVFEQIPKSHLNGSGCAYCANNRMGGTSDFIRKAKIVHGDSYAYRKADYSKSQSKVTITCHTHGDFEQRPNAHLKGAGCPDCGVSLRGFGRSDFVGACDRSERKSGMLYVIRCTKIGECFYKIGITSKDLASRFRTEHEMPYTFSSVLSITGQPDYIYDLETRLHALMYDYKHVPTIAFKGMTECFTTIKPIERLLERLSCTEQLQLIA